MYNWTNTNTAIGLGASGTGNISFTSTNATAAPITGSITVTPSYTNGGTTCTGTPITFTITVNPTPIVNPVSNQVVCNNASTSAVTFTGSATNTIYNWTNSNTTIGLAASGTGNIASFTAINSTTTPVTSTITVTPTSGLQVCNLADIPTNLQTGLVGFWPFCGNANDVSGNGLNGTVTGATLTLDRNGNVNGAYSFNSSVVSNISIQTQAVTTANGLQNQFSIVMWVKASRVVNYISESSLCPGAVSVPMANSNQNWPFAPGNGNPRLGVGFSIGTNGIMVAEHADNILVSRLSNSSTYSDFVNVAIVYNTTNSYLYINGVLVRTRAINCTSNIKCIPPLVILGSSLYSPNFSGIIDDIGIWNRALTAAEIQQLNTGVSCVGTPTTFTITVNPTPTVVAQANQTVCIGATTTASFTGAVTGTVYNWTNTNTAIGLGASGTGNISFTSTNATTAPITGSITVTPSYTNGGTTCTGTPITFTITVNPTPIVNPVSNQVLCSNASTSAVNFTSPTTGGVIIYNWTNNTASIGLASSGTGNIASFTAVNSTAVAVTATITVTPSYTNGGTTCNGTPLIFTITVNPLPSGTIQTPFGTIICNGTPLPINATGGANYQWQFNGIDIPGALGSIYNATQPGTYSVTLINTTGCRAQASNSVILTLVSKPLAAFSYLNNCIQLPVLFNNSSTTNQSGAVSYLWTFGNGNTSTAATPPSQVYSNLGTYTIKLRIIPAACPLLSDSTTSIINIVAPISSIRYPAVNAIKNVVSTLAARTIGMSYAWLPSTGLNNPFVYNPDFNYTNDVDYRIKITSSSGCITVDSLLVRAFEKVGVFVPKAFAPNGNGKNDILRPLLVRITALNYFRVYNRWGQLIYQTNSIGQGWDGTFKGVAQPIETYTWIFEGLDYLGNTVRESGKTTLVR